MSKAFNIKLLLVFFIVGIFFYSYSQTSPRSCRIKSIVGSAKIRRTGTINWLNARINMPVKERDALRTFIESEIELETSEGTIIKIGENSTLEMAKFNNEENSNSTQVKIMNGNVVANVKKLVNSRSKFEFETPTATAAIRGTTVGFEVSKEKTIIKVYEGSVWVTPQGSKAGSELKDNQMTSVSKWQKKITIEKLTEKSSLLPSMENDTNRLIINTLNTDTTLTTKDSTSTEGLENLASKSDTIDDSFNSDTKKDTINESNVTVIPVRLIISSPADGAIVKPSTPISVTGTVTPILTNITINGKRVSVGSSGAFTTTVTAPSQSGEFELSITGESNGLTQNITRTVSIKSSEFRFEITNPTEGQVSKKTTIPISGTVTPGAEVTAMSIKLPVTPGGFFSGQIPIPNEEGEIYLEFEAALDGMFQNITRKIIFEPEYRFSLMTPQNNQEVNSTTIQIRGEVLPVTSKVTALGKSLNVSTSGIFTGVITIPDEEGEIELDFEISYGLMSKSETRKIIYKKPRDISRPEIKAVLPFISDQAKLIIAVYDRSPDDEITFHYEVNGDKESEKGAPNSSFYLPLRAGQHKYILYAVDKAGNESAVLSQTITWFGTTDWSVKPVKNSDILHLPPSGPDNSYEPVYTVEFSIDNLPDNDMRLIGSVMVINKTTGETKTKNQFTDNFFSVDIKLKNHTVNTIDIVVEDIKKAVKVKTVTISIK